MNITTILKKYKTRIDQELHLFLNSKRKYCQTISKFSDRAIRYLKDYILRGGKRLRPALLFHAYKIFSPNNSEDKEIIKLSIFEEFIQAFFLIQDDFMDKDDLRRGGPTLHKMFEDFAKKEHIEDFQHLGVSMSTLVSDIAFSLYNEIFSKADLDPTKKFEAMRFISDQNNNTVLGQMHDILLEHQSDYSEKDINFIQEYKTAKYTFETPTVTGAILAGASKEQRKILSNYSIPAGIAFQIRDDILGVFGNEDKTGKSAKSDLIEGKKTLLIWYVLEHGKEKQKEIIRKYNGKKDLTEQEAETIRYVIRESGSLDYSIQQCEKYVDKAKEALEKLPNKDSEGWSFLNEIAEYMIVRDI